MIVNQISRKTAVFNVVGGDIFKLWKFRFESVVKQLVAIFVFFTIILVADLEIFQTFERLWVTVGGTL